MRRCAQDRDWGTSPGRGTAACVDLVLAERGGEPRSHEGLSMTWFQDSVTVVLFASVATAQTPVLSVHGATPADRFGASLATLGDVNGDGHDDLLAGAPFDSAAGTLAGAAYVVSGKDGSTLRTHLAIAALDHFGVSVAAAGDVDDDGTVDYVIGASEGALNGIASGYVEVYSGLTGALLWQFFGDLSGDRLGISVAGGVDVDKDGHDDVIAGAFGSDAGAAEGGLVRVYSGRLGTVLHSISGTSVGDRLGIAVSELPDINGDGFGDFAAGADQDTVGAGYAVLWSGRTGSVLFTRNGQSQGDATGFALASVGLVDADTVPDLAIASPGFDGVGTQAGRVEVLSGATGGVILTFDGPAGAQLGRGLAAALDDDGDGRDDVLIGAPFEAPGGVARVVSGADGSVLRTFASPDQGADFGAGLAAADTTGDSVVDYVVGAPRSDLGGVDAGSTLIFDGAATPIAPPVEYCTAKLSSLGCVPILAWSGQPSATDPTPFDVMATAIIRARPGRLMASFSSTISPFSGGVLCVQPPLMGGPILFSAGAAGPRDCSGSFSVDVNAWVQSGGLGAVAVGTTLYVQYWYRDPQDLAAPIGLTSGLEFLIAP